MATFGVFAHLTGDGSECPLALVGQALAEGRGGRFIAGPWSAQLPDRKNFLMNKR